MKEKHGDSNTRLYKIWIGVKGRCKGTANKRVKKDYKDRGITICDEWKNSYIAFREWSLNNGYKDNLSIDRINNDGNYEPSNCRWTNQKIQSRNTRILYSHNKSGYRGVSWNKAYKKWEVSIVVNRKTIKVGYYENIEDAACAYDTFIKSNNLEHTTNNTTREVLPNTGRKFLVTNTSGYIGVTSPKRIQKHNKKWSAQINKKNKRIFDMYCYTPLEAALYRERYIIDENLSNKRNFSEEEFNLLWTQLQEEKEKL